MNTHANKQNTPPLRTSALQSSGNILCSGSYAHDLGLYKPWESYSLRYSQLMGADDKELFYSFSPHRYSPIFHRCKQYCRMVASATVGKRAVHVLYASGSLRCARNFPARLSVLGPLAHLVASSLFPPLSSHPTEVSHA